MIRRTIGAMGIALPLLMGGCGRVRIEPAAKPVAVGKVVPPAALPVAVKLPSIRLSPASAALLPGDAGLQMIAERPGAEGGLEDRTAEVAWSAEPAGVVAIGADGYLRPLKAGIATVRATRAGEKVEAEIKVGDGPRDWDFATDIVPILTHAGCNAGGCHGKADGQNGFHLSLFGYDPEDDFQSVARGASGRRVQTLRPESSLLLQKAVGQIPHGGGQKIAYGSVDYNVLRDWIAAGAPERSGKGHGALVDVSVEPNDSRLDQPGPRQIRVSARYADGHRRDVTRMAIYKVNDESAARISETGAARLLRRAETDLVVRYQSVVASTRLAAVINPGLKYDFAALPRENVVDRELFRRLEALKVPPSPRAGDAAFLRRVSLDLTGEQPDTATVREFLKDPDPKKREKVVDDLLKSREFVQFWQIKLGDMLQISQAKFANGAGWYQSWLADQLRENAPWDGMVRELLTALGDPTVRGGGPVNYALDGIDPKIVAEQTAQRFLGLRLRCAQCHDHPFDVWTQDDYFGLAAIFAKVNRGGPPMPGAMMSRLQVSIDPKGQIEHLRTRKPAEMRLLDQSPVKVEGNADPRKPLVDWMTRPDNPYFGRAMANWAWAQFFGKGIAEPADDLSRSNPPVHPELLDALAKDFVAHKFDLRHLLRTIATSEAYGLSSGTVPENAADQRLFSHHLPRPLTAHQMADALSQVTGISQKFGPMRTARRAIEINDPGTASVLLDTFGRCPRTSGCAAVDTPQLSLRQALLLIGGNAVDDKVSSLNGYLAGLLAEDIDPEGLVELLYLKTLCRPPTVEELSRWGGELKTAASLREAAEDLFWALLNSREFAFNH